MKENFLILSLLVLAAMASGCIQNVEYSSTQPLYVSYFYTAEATYTKIEINQSKLIYTYFPQDVAQEKCKDWLVQAPCWKEEDLKTKEAILSDDEINGMIKLIEQTNFINLESSYGGAGPLQRYYSYKIFVKLGEKEKDVVYQSFPGASPEPEAFKEIKEKLLELVSDKF